MNNKKVRQTPDFLCISKQENCRAKARLGFGITNPRPKGRGYTVGLCSRGYTQELPIPGLKVGAYKVGAMQII